MVIITVIMVIIMVLYLGISLKGIKMSESQTNPGKQQSCQMTNTYVDPRDMLNYFCFYVYAQKWHLWNVKCQMLIAEQLLFSCLWSNVAVYG